MNKKSVALDTRKKQNSRIRECCRKKNPEKSVVFYSTPLGPPPRVLVFFGEKIDPHFLLENVALQVVKIAVVVKNLNRRVEPLADRSLTRRFISFGAFNYFQKIGACSPEPLTLELATQSLSLEPELGAWI